MRAESCHSSSGQLSPPEPRGAEASARSVVLLMGNPNVGKTTLFNALTGHEARVGNYPGVTVERRIGYASLRRHTNDETQGPPRHRIEIVDVPGAYSLSARSADEQIAINCALGFADQPAPDLVLLVVEAGHLSRNLYMAIQLLELGVPLVIAVNMIDEVSDNPPDVGRLSTWLGVPCVATNARHKTGLAELERTIFEALEGRVKTRTELTLAYPKHIEQIVDTIVDSLPESWRGGSAAKRPSSRDRALSLWALTSLEPHDELLGISPALRAAVSRARELEPEHDLDLEIVRTRYAFLDEHVPRLTRRSHRPRRVFSTTERIDRLLLHPLWGFLVFVLIMATVFQALFAWADPAISLIETFFSALSNAVQALMPESWVRDLITEGVIGGVGNVVVFLPQILLLFLFIGIMEDSGYMSRVAFLMDRIMKALGLHGRAFVPMLSGFACAVPAVMATRTMERQRDRILTMLVIPLMTCSARLPVYSLIIAALFPPKDVMGWLPIQGVLLLSMYVFSIVITLVAAGVLGRTAVKGRRVPLLLELPPYRLPSPVGTLKMMWGRSRLFLKEAGGVILACTIVLWALLSYPTPALNQDVDAVATSEGATSEAAVLNDARPDPQLAQNRAQAERIENSYGGRLGKAIEPILEPLGFDWKIGVGIIGAFAAREVFVSTLGLVYGIGGDADEQSVPLRERLRQERKAGKTRYTPLVGLSLMVFFALACQCMSTLAVVRRETRSLRWPLFLFSYMTVLAYVASFIVYQGGRWLGFA